MNQTIPGIKYTRYFISVTHVKFTNPHWINVIALAVAAVGLWMMLVTMYKYFYQLSRAALLKNQEGKPE